MYWSTRLVLTRHSTALLLIGCGGDGGTPPTPTSITKAAGDEQTGVVRQQLPQPLRVIVTNGGAPVDGATVTWSTDVEGGSLEPATSETGPDGIATATWTLGNFAHPQGAQAMLAGAVGSPVNFRAQGLPDAPMSLTKYSGDNQDGEPNSFLTAPIRAHVSDQFGNGIPAVPVFWTATGATVSAPIVPTNASGISVVEVLLGDSPGEATITAAVEGLLGSPVTFNAMVRASAP